MADIDYERLFRKGRLQVDNPDVPDHRQMCINYLRFFLNTPEYPSLRRQYPTITEQELDSGKALPVETAPVAEAPVVTAEATAAASETPLAPDATATASAEPVDPKTAREKELKALHAPEVLGIVTQLQLTPGKNKPDNIALILAKEFPAA